MDSVGHGEGIGLLGGSFDPVHNGHLSIAESFLQSGYLKELWVLLTPDPPHKRNQSLVDYDQRLKMLNAAFKEFNNVEVSDLERKLPTPSYTIQTLRHLDEKYPNEKFYLCIGEDSLQEFKEWKDWNLILEYCELLVAQRPNGQTVELDPEIADKTHFIFHNPVDVSSTSIRRALADGKDVSEMVPPEVNRLIKQFNLYKNH